MFLAPNVSAWQIWTNFKTCRYGFFLAYFRKCSRKLVVENVSSHDCCSLWKNDSIIWKVSVVLLQLMLQLMFHIFCLLATVCVHLFLHQKLYSLMIHMCTILLLYKISFGRASLVLAVPVPWDVMWWGFSWFWCWQC